MKLSSILPQNVGPDLIFYRILHIVNNQDATLYQENFFVQLQKHTNTSQTWPPDVVIFVRKKVQRSPLSSDGAKLFIVSVLLQKNYFTIYWQDFVFKGFNLPKYTSLPHLWHSVITFTAVSQAKQFDLSKSDEKYSSLARKVRSCQWRHAENIPKYHCLRRGSELGLKRRIHRSRIKETRKDRSDEGKRKKMKTKSLGRALAKKMK